MAEARRRARRMLALLVLWTTTPPKGLSYLVCHGARWPPPRRTTVLGKNGQRHAVVVARAAKRATAWEMLRGGSTAAVSPNEEWSVLAVANASTEMSQLGMGSPGMGSLFANVTSTRDLARLDALYATREGAGEAGVLKAYFAGAKRLWVDVALWRRLRREQKSRELTWREERVFREAPRHLARMFPILVNPLPPPFGFVLIAVASAWPRVLLTPEFWTARQWLLFSGRDSDRAKARYNKVLHECIDMLTLVSNRLVEDVGGSSSSSSSTRTHVRSDSSAQRDVTTASNKRIVDGWAAPLTVIIEPFEESMPLGIDALSRRHLVRLARIARPRPLNRWVLRFTRTARIRAKLRAAALAADRDDQRLARDFGEDPGFSSADLFRVCSQRGLSVTGDDADRARRVQAWLDARAALLTAHPLGGPLPPSLVLHMPALFSSLAHHHAS